MILKAQKEDIIPHPDKPEYNASKSTNYIWQFECKSYIFCRDKLKQVLKLLFLLHLGQCHYALKTKHQKRNDFRALKVGGSNLKIIDNIKEDRYGLLRSEYPPVLYHRAYLKFYHQNQGNETHDLTMADHV